MALPALIKTAIKTSQLANTPKRSFKRSIHDEKLRKDFGMMVGTYFVGLASIKSSKLFSATRVHKNCSARNFFHGS